MEKIIHNSTDNPICPYCGHEERDVFDLFDSGEIECTGCGREFHYEKNVWVTWDTSEI